MRNFAITTIAVALIAAGATFYSWTKRGFSTRMAPGPVDAYLASSVREWSVPKRSRQLKNPIECSDATLEEARAHWADHCSTCHANNGSGDSMLGKTMYPRPPDMRKAATQGETDGELYYTIKNGVRLSGMPAFGDAGDQDGDSWKLVCFVRHLPRLSPEEERRMEHLNPKTPDELEEEKQEDQFLNGGTPPPDNHHHH